MSQLTNDPIDLIRDQWAEEKPDLDISYMPAVTRIVRLGNVTTNVLSEVLRPFNIDFVSFDLLTTLRRVGPPYEMFPSEIAELMVITPGAVAQRLARLEGEGLISRTHQNQDRRRVTVTLTPLGIETTNSVMNAIVDEEREILSVLTLEEIDELTMLLKKILDHLSRKD